MKKLLIALLAITALFLFSFGGCGLLEDVEEPTSTSEQTSTDTETSTGTEIPETFTVTFTVDNEGYGTVSPEIVENVSKDSPIALDGATLTIGETVVTATPTEATAEYTYSFAGFECDVTTITENIAVTVKFTRTVNEYTVSFEMGEGTAKEAVTAEYGTYIGDLTSDVTAPEHYHFVKWQIVADGASYDLTSDATLTGDVTLAAVYEIDTYTVNVTPNDATYGTVSAASVENVPYGTEITVNNNVITIGNTAITATATESDAQYTYTFTGFTGTVNSVTDDVEITANFTRELNEYTVMWIDGMGEKANIVETYDYGETLSFPWAYFEKVGDGTYIYSMSVERSVDGGENWTAQGSLEPWGGNLTEFNAGLSVVETDVQYRITYNNVSPVTALSGGDGFTVVQSGNEFTFSNIKTDNTANSFRVHSDLLRYAFDHSTPRFDVKIEAIGDESASISVESRISNLGEHPEGAAFKSASGTGSVVLPAYWMTKDGDSAFHCYVDVKIDGGTATGFKATLLMTVPTAEETAAFDVLAAGLNTWNEPASWFGKYGGIGSSCGSITVVVQKRSTATRGLALTSSAVAALAELNVKTISFKIISEMGYVSFYDASETLYPNEYLTTTYASEGTTYYDWYVASGTAVTIDLSVLAGNASFMSGTGLYVVMLSACEWNVGTDVDCAFTWSGIDFTFLSEGETEEFNEIQKYNEAFSAFTSTSSWSDSCYHGKKTSISASGDTLSLSVSTNYMNHAGLKLETSAISALNALNVKAISFEVTSSMGYVSFYNGSETLYPNEYLTTTFASVGTAYHDWFIASGTTVTINISALASSAAVMSATGDSSGIYVVMTSDTVWGSGTGSAGTLTFSGIEFTFLTDEEIQEMKYQTAFIELAKSSNWNLDCYFGYHGSVSASEGAISVYAEKKYTSQVGSLLKTSAISALSDLGIKTVSFEVTSSMGYVSFYDASETLYPNEYLTTTFASTGTAYHDWFIASGTTVTIDVSVLAGNATFMAGDGIYVVMTDGLAWSGNGNPSTLTLSGIAFNTTPNTTPVMTEEEQAAFNVLAAASSWGDHYHGFASSVSESDGTVSVYTTKNYSEFRGFTLKSSAIQALYDLGFSAVSFRITSPSGHIDLYNMSDPANCLSGTTEFIDAGTEYYYASGTIVTLNLANLVKDATAMGGDGIKFVVTGTAAWTGYDTNCTVTFSDITFTAMPALTLEEQAFNVLATASSWGDHYHGRVSGVNSGDDAISVSTIANYSEFRGFTLTPAAIQALYDLGFSAVSFKITTPSGYIDLYNVPDPANDLGGTTAAIDGTEYYYASGTTVTVNIANLVENATFMSGDGIKFVLTSTAGWTAYSVDCAVTFSDISFTVATVLTLEEQAFNVLTSASSYGDQYHGNFGGITTSGDSIIVNANKGTDDGRGFVITPAAVTALYDLGFETVSFTITATSGCVCIYHDTGNNKYALSGGSLEGGDCMYYQNGDTVTIDLKALAENAGWASSNFGIYFVVTSDLGWHFYTTDGTITLSEVEFEETENFVATPVKLKIATTTGDLNGNYSTGNYRNGYLADDKAILDLMYEAGFRYADLSMYSFTADCDYMQPDWEDKIAELKAYAETLGITFVQAHSQGGNALSDNATDVATLISQTLRQIEICWKLGIENIVVHAGWHAGYTKQQWFAANKDFFDVLLAKAETCGVNVLCENSTAANMGAMYYINSGADMREFIEYVNHPNFHGCWDTGHGNCEGDQYADIIALGDEMYAIHFNDNMGNSDAHIIPYFGTLNVDRVMRALQKIGFSGYFTFECDGSARVNDNWHGPQDLQAMSSANYGDRLWQETLMYQIGEYILSSYDMLAD